MIPSPYEGKKNNQNKTKKAQNYKIVISFSIFTSSILGSNCLLIRILRVRLKARVIPPRVGHNNNCRGRAPDCSLHSSYRCCMSDVCGDRCGKPQISERGIIVKGILRLLADLEVASNQHEQNKILGLNILSKV